MRLVNRRSAVRLGWGLTLAFGFFIFFSGLVFRNQTVNALIYCDCSDYNNNPSGCQSKTGCSWSYATCAVSGGGCNYSGCTYHAIGSCSGVSEACDGKSESSCNSDPRCGWSGPSAAYCDGTPSSAGSCSGQYNCTPPTNTPPPPPTNTPRPPTATPTPIGGDGC